MRGVGTTQGGRSATGGRALGLMNNRRPARAMESALAGDLAGSSPDSSLFPSHGASLGTGCRPPGIRHGQTTPFSAFPSLIQFADGRTPVSAADRDTARLTEGITPPGLDPTVAAGSAGPLPGGADAAAEGAGGAVDAVQRAAHLAREDGVAQDAGGACAVPAALLPGSEGQGRVQDAAGSAQARASACSEARPSRGSRLPTASTDQACVRSCSRPRHPAVRASSS
jgi:hypothetical protein